MWLDLRRRFARWYLAGHYRRKRRSRDLISPWQQLKKHAAHHRLWGNMGYVAQLGIWVKDTAGSGV